MTSHLVGWRHPAYPVDILPIDGRRRTSRGARPDVLRPPGAALAAPPAGRGRVAVAARRGRPLAGAPLAGPGATPRHPGRARPRAGRRHVEPAGDAPGHGLRGRSLGLDGRAPRPRDGLYRARCARAAARRRGRCRRGGSERVGRATGRRARRVRRLPIGRRPRGHEPGGGAQPRRHPLPDRVSQARGAPHRRAAEHGRRPPGGAPAARRGDAPRRRAPGAQRGAGGAGDRRRRPDDAAPGRARDPQGRPAQHGGAGRDAPAVHGRTPAA